jgi:deoxyhypusine synthase
VDVVSQSGPCGHVVGLWQVDQNFLRESVYNRIKGDCFVHDSYHNYESFKKQFPKNRNHE